MDAAIEIPVDSKSASVDGFMTEPPASSDLTGLIGESEAIGEVRALIRQVAEFDSNVLVLGESGTGKELVARAIHDMSDRADRPFVPVNCGAIPSELLESELFGHEKGAFTGALARRRGRFELAEGGTLFLDEIGDMPVAMQVKLLRVLQERSFERVGGTETLRCNVRVIAATHRDIETRIERGEFREDLYYRLNVFPIQVPPLRERPEDVPPLVEHFRAALCRRGMGETRFSEGALAALSTHAWPGNVRELLNLVERMTILRAGRSVQARDLPPRYRQELPTDEDALGRRVATASPDLPFEERALPELPDEGVDLKSYLSNVETDLIRQALEETGGTVAHAAELLGLRRTTLVEKMKKHGLSATEY
ncbi:sigma-54-dependent transcriptional regulator [Wenzhouxiangella sp. AB-CW3]|uniref:sigma-54-dependent transcriptional regulator n=1 Tax=Wenzhouxiangella sp. AB-CW3 TaxID=2771012 RepID=UPI001CC2F828